MTMSGIKWKDIVCCKTFSVKRHCQFRQFLLRHCWLWDIFCFYQKRHCPLWDIFSFQTLAVVRHRRLSDTCSFQILAVFRHLQLSDTFSYQTFYIMRHFLLPTYLLVSVGSWSFQLTGTKLAWFYQKKCHGLQDKYCILWIDVMWDKSQINRSLHVTIFDNKLTDFD